MLADRQQWLSHSHKALSNISHTTALFVKKTATDVDKEVEAKADSEIIAPSNDTVGQGNTIARSAPLPVVITGSPDYNCCATPDRRHRASSYGIDTAALIDHGGWDGLAIERCRAI